MEKIRLSAPLQKESVTDGPGLRMVIWNQGCQIHCPGCHNQETWDLHGGREYPLEEILNDIRIYKNHHQGITLSGGDTFLQTKENKMIAQVAHEEGLDVWAYCGLTFEQILNNPDKLDLLKECDVLVDGPFIQEQRDITLKFKGSSNQRLIDVPKSLERGEVVLYE